ncbi:hypothetical protein BH20PSE1_BH20PSE1_06320 [soil metagenome]|jgi:hypothetical protein
MSEVAAIKDYLAANVEIAPADLMRDQPFSGWGGVTPRRLMHIFTTISYASEPDHENHPQHR